MFDKNAKLKMQNEKLNYEERRKLCLREKAKDHSDVLDALL